MSEEKEPAYVIQARITASDGKHTCKICGGKASFLFVNYELADQVTADTMNQQIRAQESFESLLAYVKSDTKEQDAIWRGTLAEQTKMLPQEHLREFECRTCVTEMVNMAMGFTGGAEIGIRKCQQHPTKNAVFLVRQVSDPTTLLMVAVDFQDVARAVQFLQDNDSIGRQ